MVKTSRIVNNNAPHHNNFRLSCGESLIKRRQVRQNYMAALTRCQCRLLFLACAWLRNSLLRGEVGVELARLKYVRHFVTSQLHETSGGDVNDTADFDQPGVESTLPIHFGVRKAHVALFGNKP